MEGIVAKLHPILVTAIIILIVVLFAYVVFVRIIRKGSSFKAFGFELPAVSQPEEIVNENAQYPTNNGFTQPHGYEGIYELYHYAPHSNLDVLSIGYLSIKQQLNGHPVIEHLQKNYYYDSGSISMSKGSIFIHLQDQKSRHPPMLLVLKENNSITATSLRGILLGLSERCVPVALIVWLSKAENNKQDFCFENYSSKCRLVDLDTDKDSRVRYSFILEQLENNCSDKNIFL